MYHYINLQIGSHIKSSIEFHFAHSVRILSGHIKITLSIIRLICISKNSCFRIRMLPDNGAYFEY